MNLENESMYATSALNIPTNLLSKISYIGVSNGEWVSVVSWLYLTNLSKV